MDFNLKANAVDTNAILPSGKKVFESITVTPSVLMRTPSRGFAKESKTTAPLGAYEVDITANGKILLINKIQGHFDSNVGRHFVSNDELISLDLAAEPNGVYKLILEINYIDTDTINNIYPLTDIIFKTMLDTVAYAGTGYELAKFTQAATISSIESSKLIPLDGLILPSKGDKQLGDYRAYRQDNGMWDAMQIEKLGGTLVTVDINGTPTDRMANFTGLDIVNRPLDSSKSLLEEEVDAAVTAMTKDALGGYKLAGIYNNNYPNSNLDGDYEPYLTDAFGKIGNDFYDNMVGIEVVAGGQNTIMPPLVEFSRNKTAGQDIKKIHKVLDTIHDEYIYKAGVKAFGLSEHNEMAIHSAHGFSVGQLVKQSLTADGVNADGSPKYVWHLGKHSQTSDNMGVIVRVLTPDIFIVAKKGSYIENLQNTTIGDTLYANNTWGGVTTTEPSLGGIIIGEVGDKFTLLTFAPIPNGLLVKGSTLAGNKVTIEGSSPSVYFKDTSLGDYGYKIGTGGGNFIIADDTDGDGLHEADYGNTAFGVPLFLRKRSVKEEGYIYGKKISLETKGMNFVDMWEILTPYGPSSAYYGTIERAFVGLREGDLILVSFSSTLSLNGSTVPVDTYETVTFMPKVFNPQALGGTIYSNLSANISVITNSVFGHERISVKSTALSKTSLQVWRRKI